MVLCYRDPKTIQTSNKKREIGDGQRRRSTPPERQLGGIPGNWGAINQQEKGKNQYLTVHRLLPKMNEGLYSVTNREERTAAEQTTHQAKERVVFQGGRRTTSHVGLDSTGPLRYRVHQCP